MDVASAVIRASGVCSRREKEEAQMARRRAARREGREAEVGRGLTLVCGWTRELSPCGELEAPWTPHTGTLPGPLP